MAYVHNPLASIAQRCKGTYDIAGAAEFLHNEAGLRWSMNANGFSRVSTTEQLFAIRTMCCYEFVHLAAFLAGHQRTAGGLRCGSDPGSVYQRPNARAWTKPVGNLARGKIVTFVSYGINPTPAPWQRHSRWLWTQNVNRILGHDNNSGGYFHVGICRGDGNVISLSADTNVNFQRLSDMDDFYYEVRYADYNWFVAQGDAGAPRLP